MPNKKLRLLILLLLLVLVVACNGNNLEAEPTDVARREVVSNSTPVFPAPLPPTQVKPTNTLVMAQPWTPTPIPTSTAIPETVKGFVIGVQDPEQIVVALNGDPLEKTYVVRLIGVKKPTEIDPWLPISVETLDRWLTGRIITLVSDAVSITDQKELPRYLYLGDTFINEALIDAGLATYEADGLNRAEAVTLRQANNQAQSAEIGLWGPAPTPTPLATTTLTTTLTVTASVGITVTPTLTTTATLTPTAVVSPTATQAN